MSSKKHIPSFGRGGQKDQIWLKKKLEQQDKVLATLRGELEALEKSNQKNIAKVLGSEGKIQNLSNVIEANAKSSADHISLLANFARHDVANYIQNMDAILSTTDIENVSKETFDRLHGNIQSIREVMTNFAALVPHSENGVFPISQLIGAAESMNRALLARNRIKFFKEYPNLEISMRFPFQALLQVLNNLISNACKSKCYPDSMIEDKRIKLSYALSGEILSIKIFDNGIIIPEEERESIFKYGYTNTQGSGIGLFHAEYICNLLKGGITIEDQHDGIYTKCFCINIPIERLEDA